MPVDSPTHQAGGATGEWVGAFFLTWVLGAVAGSLVLVVTGTSDPDTVTPIPALAASLVSGWAVYTAGSVIASRRYGTGNVAADLGITARPADVIGVGIGVIAQLAVVPAVYAPLRTIWPDTFDDEALSETATDLVDRADGALLALLFVLVVAGAPLFEELLYRGFLQRPLLDRFPTPVVLVAVAAVFALVHFRPVEYPGLFVAGLVFGLCAWWTGRLGTAVAAHVGFNLVGLVLAL